MGEEAPTSQPDHEPLPNRGVSTDVSLTGPTDRSRSATVSPRSAVVQRTPHSRHATPQPRVRYAFSVLDKTPPLGSGTKVDFLSRLMEKRVLRENSAQPSQQGHDVVGTDSNLPTGDDQESRLLSFTKSSPCSSVVDDCAKLPSAAKIFEEKEKVHVASDNFKEPHSPPDLQPRSPPIQQMDSLVRGTIPEFNPERSGDITEEPMDSSMRNLLDPTPDANSQSQQLSRDSTFPIKNASELWNCHKCRRSRSVSCEPRKAKNLRLRTPPPSCRLFKRFLFDDDYEKCPLQIIRDATGRVRSVNNSKECDLIRSGNTGNFLTTAHSFLQDEERVNNCAMCKAELAYIISNLIGEKSFRRSEYRRSKGYEFFLGIGRSNQTEQHRMDSDQPRVPRGPCRPKNLPPPSIGILKNAPEKPEPKKEKRVQFTPEVVLFDELSADPAKLNKKERSLRISCIAKKVNVHVCNPRGVTPLHIAAFRNDLKVLSLLVDMQADVNVLDDDHWSPLHVAAKWGSFEIVQLLLLSGACPLLRCRPTCPEFVREGSTALNIFYHRPESSRDLVTLRSLEMVTRRVEREQYGNGTLFVAIPYFFNGSVLPVGTQITVLSRNKDSVIGEWVLKEKMVKGFVPKCFLGIVPSTSSENARAVQFAEDYQRHEFEGRVLSAIISDEFRRASDVLRFVKGHDQTTAMEFPSNEVPFSFGEEIDGVLDSQEVVIDGVDGLEIGSLRFIQLITFLPQMLELLENPKTSDSGANTSSLVRSLLPTDTSGIDQRLVESLSDRTSESSSSSAVVSSSSSSHSGPARQIISNSGPPSAAEFACLYEDLSRSDPPAPGVVNVDVGVLLDLSPNAASPQL